MVKRVIRHISVISILSFALSMLVMGDSGGGSCSMELCDGQARYTKCVKQFGYPAIMTCNGKTQTSIMQCQACIQVATCTAACNPWVE